MTYLQFVHECGKRLFHSEEPAWEVIRETLRKDLKSREKEGGVSLAGLLDDFCEELTAPEISKKRFVSVRIVYYLKERITIDGMIYAAQLGIINMKHRLID